jgi:hypothetical protein
MTIEKRGHISPERIWAAIRDERDLTLPEYLHVFNCGSCGRFLDVCLNAPSLEDALRIYAGLKDCDKAA